MAGDNHPHWSVSGIGCGTAGEGTAGMLSDFGGVTGLITFTDGIKEVTFKTPYKDPGMEDLVSEGHDLLSSRVILSEDDYWRGCKKASDLENEFYTYVDKLDPLYKGEIDRIYLDEVCEYFSQEITNRNCVHKFFQENEYELLTVSGDGVRIFPDGVKSPDL
ncbi:hypothetical protein Tco_1318339 [Tanacetum coccineum]